MNLFALSGLLIGITSSAMAIFVYLKDTKNLVNRIWLLLAFSIGIWGFGGYRIALIKEANLALFFWRVTHIGVIFIPILFLHFVHVYLQKKKKRPVIIAYICGIFFIIMNITGQLINNVEWVFDSFYYDGRPPTILYAIFTLLWVLAAVFTHYELFKAFRKEVGIRRVQIRYFFLATIIGYGGGATCFIPVFGIDIYPYLNFTVVLYPLIMAYAIVKYQLMDIKVAVTRAGIFLFVYTLVLGFPFWVGYKIKIWFIPTLFMFVLATIGPLIYRFLQKRAENLLLAQQKHYQHVLLQAAKGMTREHDLGKLLKVIVYIVKRAVKIEFAAIFLEDKENNCYGLRAVRDHSTFPAHFSFPRGHPLIKAVRKSKTILTYEEISPLSAGICDCPAHLVVPSFVEDDLRGFIVLGEKENRSLYTDDDINVFRILSYHAALAIENCLFFEEFKKANEKIFVAEKLASIGGMADGVAHQVKNRLNLFSVASGEMQFEIRDFMKEHSRLIQGNPPLKKTFNYLSKIAKSLIANVKRTDDIIKGILNYARTSQKDTFFSEFSLKEIIGLSLDLLKVKHEIAEFPLAVDVGADDIIYGVKSQVMESFYNILDNGYEAIQEKRSYLANEGQSNEFKPEIKVTLTKKAGFSLMEIDDNGMGIKEGDWHKIFAPFFTTKSSYKSGTGIGMYVVKRMIEENHHGHVWFKSKYTEGTKFYVRLPDKGIKS